MSRKESQKPGRVMLLPIDSIEPSPYQARTAFDEPEIAALAVSILQNGLLQPISVRRVGLRKYQLVAGERRLRACRLAKLEKIPAILSDFDDSESAALGLLENLQRSQLDPFDTARGIKEVIRLWGCTQAEAARRLGLSQPALANKLRLLTLTPEQQDLCTANHLSERHARAVLRLPESRRTAALEKIARENMSVRQADKLVDTMLAAPKAPSPCRKTIPMVRDVRFFVNTLQHAVDLMTQKGIAATTSCDKRDGCLEYIVRIPVGSDGRVATAAPAPSAAAPSPGAGQAAPLSPAGAGVSPAVPAAAAGPPAPDADAPADRESFAVPLLGPPFPRPRRTGLSGAPPLVLPPGMFHVEHSLFYLLYCLCFAFCSILLPERMKYHAIYLAFLFSLSGPCLIRLFTHTSQSTLHLAVGSQLSVLCLLFPDGLVLSSLFYRCHLGNRIGTAQRKPA